LPAHRLQTLPRSVRFPPIPDIWGQSLQGTFRAIRSFSFALAFLANFAEERWPFDNFWRAIATRDPKVRSATVTAARNAIHRAVKG